MESLSILEMRIESVLLSAGYSIEDDVYVRVMQIHDIIVNSSANNTDKRRILGRLVRIIDDIHKRQTQSSKIS